MIRMEHVSKTYEAKVQAVNDINLHIRPGEFVFIVGESGSGKSTIIKMLLREIMPSSGKLLVDGKNLSLIARK